MPGYLRPKPEGRKGLAPARAVQIPCLFSGRARTRLRQFSPSPAKPPQRSFSLGRLQRDTIGNPISVFVMLEHNRIDAAWLLKIDLNPLLTRMQGDHLCVVSSL
jgi:hypothetical protein